MRRADVRYQKPMKIPGTVLVGLANKFRFVVELARRIIRSVKRGKLRVSKPGILW